MKTSSYTLLPTITFGTANDNYDGVSSSFSSDPVKAAAYYSKTKSLQTVSWYLSNLVAVVKFEATLDKDPDTSNYFPILVLGDGVNPLSENNFQNIEGNYTWIRVTIEQFTAGVIEKISIGY